MGAQGACVLSQQGASPPVAMLADLPHRASPAASLHGDPGRSTGVRVQQTPHGNGSRG